MLLKYQEDMTRGGAMLGTGLVGWLVQNAEALDIVAKLAVAAFTCVAILIQIGLAIHKHIKKEERQ